MFLETVSLVLKHSDISTALNTNPPVNNVGSWSSGKQSTTWRFNMRHLLGSEIYDNNDLFVLRLNQLSYATANFPLNPQDQQVIVTLSGLNFVNSTYDVKTGNTGSQHQSVLLNIGTTAGVESYSPNIAMCNFGKSGDYVNLSIDLIRTIDGLAGQFGMAFYPHMVYQFDIYPVKKNM
jgi:hypothetical protein